MSSCNKIKTITSLIDDKNTKYILDHLTKISKNVYNCTIYCMTIFQKYKQSIFKEIYNETKNIKFEKGYDKTILEKRFYELYEIKYNQYQTTQSIIKNNNEIIYKFIKIALFRIELNNDNFYFFRNLIIYNIRKNKDIVYNDKNIKEVVIDIIDNILKSRYNKEYFRIKKCINNKIPITNASNEFIDFVMKNKYLFKETKKKVDWKKKIENKLPNEIKEEKEVPGKLISDNNIVGRVTYKNLGENLDKLPSDIIVNTVQKAYNGYSSFYALRSKGIKANMPKYLDKDGHYIIQLFKDHGMKIIEKNNKKFIRLIVGKHIAKNYMRIVHNNDLVCLNENNSTEYKLYINKTYLKQSTKKVSKSKNFIVTIKKNNIEKTYYVPKNHNKIIDANYLYIPISKKISKKNIKMIEIKPLYEGHSYKSCIVYENDKSIEIKDIKDNSKSPEDNSISIDLGMLSLMTIYNPTGIQQIVDGKYLLWLNKSYNELIDKLKSDTQKLNSKYTSKQIRNLLIERNNKITDYFNRIVKWISLKYSNKKLIIIGYNVNWKKGVDMGKKNNRNFYQIPYCKLLDMLKNKMMQYGIKVIINEESYTSKCDSLALEEVCKHNTYLGKRIKRGLFQSSTGKLLNADLNGAINIMRKYFLQTGYKMTEIKGHNLYNPLRANINYDAMYQPVV